MLNQPTNEQIREAFGSAVRALREGAGISQRALSLMSGVRPQALSRLEQGKVYPRLDTVACITKALNVHPAEPFRRMAEELGMSPMSIEVDLDGVSRNLLQVSEDLTTAGVPEVADGDPGGHYPLSVPERLRWFLRKTASSNEARLDRVSFLGLTLPGNKMVFDVSVEEGSVSQDLGGAVGRPLRVSMERRVLLMATLPGVVVTIFNEDGEVVH